MFKLDNAFLEELGLGALPPTEKNKMLAHVYETLEMRVGMRLAEQMSNEQLEEFESFIKSKDEAGALKWLETNFPDYKQVVANELEKLRSEIKQVAPQIVAQAQETAAAAPAPAAQPSVAPQAQAVPQYRQPSGAPQAAPLQPQYQQPPLQPTQAPANPVAPQPAPQPPTTLPTAPAPPPMPPQQQPVSPVPPTTSAGQQPAVDPVTQMSPADPQQPPQAV